MDNIAGSPVEGDNFFGRKDVVSDLRGILHHDDILLLGPRRIGKTSTARAVMSKVRAEKWQAIEINVASCQDERGFLEKLDSALKPVMTSATSQAWQAVAEKLKSATARIKTAKISIPGGGGVTFDIGNQDVEDWASIGIEVLALIAQAEEPWLIYVDELPIMLFTIIRNDSTNGVRRVRRFLDWLRNDVRAIPGNNKVRWLISGSVGLDTLVQEHHMSDTINSLSHQGLSPFSEEEAIKMLYTLAESYKIQFVEADAKKLVHAINWPQPYYLQLAFNHLRNLIRSSPNVDISTLIDNAVDKLIQPGSDNDFHHWEQRLTLQLSIADANHAQALLTDVAQDINGRRAVDLLVNFQSRMPNATEEDVKKTFIRLRDILERDAYWWADESNGVKRYKFRLEPLRRWWLRRNSL